MKKATLARFLIILAIAATIFCSVDEHKKKKSKHRHRRYFFDPTCPELCLQEPSPGNCSMWLHKYSFNALTLTCTKFLYTGCGKNDNYFETLAECQSTCGGCATPTPAPVSVP